MSDLKVKIAGVEFLNPVIAASGTFNFGQEFKEFYSPAKLGGISLKGLTREPRQGNPSPRIAETYGGILNSVGLQNPGIEHFIKVDLPALKDSGTVLIANIAGNTLEDYCFMAEKINNTAVDMVELNISCPNVKKGGAAFGVYPESVKEVVSSVRKYLSKPLIVKLTPNTADITLTAKAAEDAGADALSLINTITGMAVDIKSRRPILANITGGLSGPAVKPVALRMVWQVYNTVKLPIIGMGGITTWEDAVEFMLCGATAVQVGTANITDPYAMPKIIEVLRCYAESNGIKEIKEITGALKI